MGDFKRCTDIVLSKTIEGGFVNDPNDNGGATNHGITIGTLSTWRGKRCSVQDVQNLTVDEALRIYRAMYWQPVAGDDLPTGLDLIVFDCAVNQGIGRGTKALQKAVGVAVDGHVGPRTVAAAKACNVLQAISSVRDYRLAKYMEADDWPRYKNGWQNRLKTIYETSLKWVSGK